MKSKLTSLLLVLFIANFHAQNSFILMPKNWFKSYKTTSLSIQNQSNKHNLNTKQKLDSTAYLVWQKNEQNFVFSNKDTFIYNEVFNITNYQTYRWDNIASQWVNETQTINSYDQDQNLIEIIYKDWVNNTWQYQTKLNFTYNTSNKLTQIDYYEWQNNAWEYTAKKEMIYTSEELLENETYFLKNYNSITEDWTPDYKIDYTYNTDGQQTLSQSYIWDDLKKIWNNNEKITATYSSNLLQDEVTTIWDNDLAEWLNVYRSVYTYDHNGFIIEIDGMSWESSTSSWQYETQTILVRDTSNNIISSTDLYWQNGAWVNDYKIENIYDNTYSLDDLILPQDVNDWQFFDQINSYFQHMLVKQTSFNWDESLNQWQSNDQKELFYTSDDNITASIKLNNNDLKIYPNPFEAQLHLILPDFVSEANFILSDITGKVVYQQTLNNTNDIPLKHLSSGIYFYQVIGKNWFKKGRLLKS